MNAGDVSGTYVGANNILVSIAIQVAQDHKTYDDIQGIRLCTKSCLAKCSVLNKTKEDDKFKNGIMFHSWVSFKESKRYKF